MNKTSKTIILKLVRDAQLNAMRADRRATAGHAAAKAGAKVWDNCNPKDGIGGISMNPYNVTDAEKMMREARVRYDTMTEAYNYAVNTFI